MADSTRSGLASSGLNGGPGVFGTPGGAGAAGDDPGGDGGHGLPGHERGDGVDGAGAQPAGDPERRPGRAPAATRAARARPVTAAGEEGAVAASLLPVRQRQRQRWRRRRRRRRRRLRAARRRSCRRVVRPLPAQLHRQGHRGLAESFPATGAQVAAAATAEVKGSAAVAEAAPTTAWTRSARAATAARAAPAATAAAVEAAPAAPASASYGPPSPGQRSATTRRCGPGRRDPEAPAAPAEPVPEARARAGSPRRSTPADEGTITMNVPVSLRRTAAATGALSWAADGAAAAPARRVPAFGGTGGPDRGRRPGGPARRHKR